MKFYTSVITEDGEFAGPEIEADSFKEAEEQAEEMYVIVLGRCGE